MEKKLREVFNKPYKLRCIIVESKTEAVSKKDKEISLTQVALDRGAKIIGQKQNTEET